MKSYNHLYERFISDENYYLAVRNATKHKGGKKRKWRYARYIRNNADELKPRFIEYASNFKNAHHKPKVSFKALRLYEGHWQKIHNTHGGKNHVKLV